MNISKPQVMTPGGSLAIFGSGVLLQIILYVVGLAILIPNNNHPVIEPIIIGVMVLVFFFPLVGIPGIVVGVKCHRRNIGRFLPLLGIILNMLWVGLLAAACYLTFIVRVTV